MTRLLLAWVLVSFLTGPLFGLILARCDSHDPAIIPLWKHQNGNG